MIPRPLLRISAHFYISRRIWTKPLFLATNLLHYILNFFSIYPAHKKFIVNLWRFIDDLFGGWSGTIRQLRSFIHCFNEYERRYGVVFHEEQFGDTVNFLNVSVSNCTGVIVTDLYHKPWDAHRYLHHISFHPEHTFSGIPYSQMRRVVLICSTNYLQDIAINDMISYFTKCGYNDMALRLAKGRVLSIIGRPCSKDQC